MTKDVDKKGKKRKLSGYADMPTSIMTEASTQDCNKNGREEGNVTIVETISYVEFYSGVGGWTMALEKALDRLVPLLSSIGKGKNTTDTSVRSRQGQQQRYQLKRLAALDHSDLCVKVFAHNFGSKERRENNNDKEERTGKEQKKRKGNALPKSFSIERMPLRQLEEWSADVWVMSPPCQPHTRQHNDPNQQQREENHTSGKKDLDDPRSKSFLNICEWLEGSPDSDTTNEDSKLKGRLHDECLPSLIFLENVVGFESSRSFQRWTSALTSRGYRMGHFHLTPTQVGLPNDRPRYYCVAIRDSFSCDNEEHTSSSLVGSPDSHSGESVLLVPSALSLWTYFDGETIEATEERGDKNIHLQGDIPRIWKSIPEVQVAPENSDGFIGESEVIPPISGFLDNMREDEKRDSKDLLCVPEKVWLSKSAWCFDIVCPNDRRSSCFTHSYGRFIKGTGSILYNGDTKSSSLKLIPPEEREFSDTWRNGIDPSKLRYFSGMELARLFGFSEHFSFPKDTSPKQQWKLMGNSLNVGVASKLVELGFLLRYYHYYHN